jgi:hypothetical protein
MQQSEKDYNSFSEEMLARYREVIEDNGGVVSGDCERIIGDGLRLLVEEYIRNN